MENIEALLKMEKELYVAAMQGNLEFLEKIKSNEYLLGKTPQKNNVLHIAVQCENIEFIEAVLRRLVPNKREVLLCEKNSKGNTPLHIAVETGNIDVVKKLYGHLLDVKTVAGNAEKPWMKMKNKDGNTAAHVAIIRDNLEIAMFLLDKDPGLACITNESKEAALHLAVKNHVPYCEKNSVKARIHRELNITKPAKSSSVPAEDMTSIIKFLVEQAGYVTCSVDANGFTPLHRAASLSAPYNLQIITFMIEQWPLSAEVCDDSGNCILHLLVNKIPVYRDLKRLMSMKELYNLRNCQNDQGNTPLHIAALDRDINMVRALLESETNPSIINVQGVDATFVIQQQHIIEKLKTISMSEEEREAADKGDIAFLKESLTNFGVDFLHSQDSFNGQNLLHKLFKLPIKVTQEGIFWEENDPYYDFIKQVMSSYPALVCQTDFNGDTPIHVLVSNNVDIRVPSLIRKRLELCNDFIKEMEEEASSNNNEAPSYDPPWVVQNVHGNTPLHQALIAANNGFDNYEVVKKLMEYNKRPIDLCNKRGETLYHLFKDNHFLLRNSIIPPLERLLPPEDEDGFTPLMRAIQGGWEDTAIHLLYDNKSSWWYGRDKKGNTPLHMAIQHQHFRLFRKMLHHLEKEKEDDIFLADLVIVDSWENEANETCSDLIGELDYLPPDLEKQILKNPELRGIRSAWSIPKSQLQNYMSSVNVIAALLTTITFTAAFTVPGGLDQEEGTPLLLAKSIAFQVFIVSDVIAMCLSMMVLFCLLWIVATDKRNSVMIQDFAITLLLASFVATLLTFMAGVYATISSIKPGIAIATLVLCSLLMLLVHRFVLTNLVIPFKNLIRHPIYSVKLSLEKICDKIIDMLDYLGLFD